MKVVAKWISGSRLYGTNTPESDMDYTAVFMESLDNIILMRDLKQRTTTTGEISAKNTSSDVDVSEKELRVFINDAMAGQSYAIEALFVPEDMLLETSDEYRFLVANRSKLIGNLKPIVSFCRKQAQIYSKKAENISSLDQAIDKIAIQLADLAYESGSYGKVWKLQELDLFYDDYCVAHEQDGIKFYKVGTTMYQMNSFAIQTLAGLRNRRSKYGKRAENIGKYDGKAYSHAFRLAYQYSMLVRTGELILPLPQREFLTNIKLEKYSKEYVVERLEHLMGVIENLPEVIGEPDRKFWDNWLLEVYKR